MPPFSIEFSCNSVLNWVTGSVVNILKTVCIQSGIGVVWLQIKSYSGILLSFQRCFSKDFL